MAAALVVISVTPQAAWADKRDGDWYGWQKARQWMLSLSAPL